MRLVHAPVDLEGDHALRILQSEYLRARMNGQQQRQDDIREAIEIAWKRWATP